MPEEEKKPEYRRWKPSGETKGSFLLVHGLGAHTGRWEAMADFLLKKGLASYAAEFGDIDNPDMPAYRTGHFKSYFKGIEALYDFIKKENPGKKIFLAGESMGALISFLFVSANPGLFDGLVCISPAFENRYKVTFCDFFKMFTPLLYNPKKTHPVPFDSSFCTRDEGYIRKMGEDPEERRLITSRLIMELILAEVYARHVRGTSDIPVLFLLAGDDRIVDTERAKKVFMRLKTKDKELIEFPGMYHALSIDIGKEKVFEEIFKWIEGRIS